MAARRVATLCAAVLLAALLTTGADAKKGAAKWTIASDTHPHVKPVSAKTFRDDVMAPTRPVLLFVYSPKNNKANKEMFPAIFGAADALHEYVDFVAMDYSTQEGREIAGMFGVQSTPTIRYFNPEMGQAEGAPEGQYLKHPLGYGGPSTAAKVAEFAMQAMAGHQIAAVEDSVDWLALFSKYPQFRQPRVVLVTAQNVTAFAFKAASHEFRYGAQFGVVHGASVPPLNAKGEADLTAMPMTLKSELLGQLRPARLPCVLVFPAGEQTTPSVVIDDPEKLRRAALYEEIAKHVITKEQRAEATGLFIQTDEEEKKALKQKEKQRQSKREPLPVIVTTDAEEWQEACTERTDKGVCVLAFVEDLEKDVNREELEKAAKTMALRSRTPAQIVVIPAWPNWKLAKFFNAHEDGYPTVVFVNPAKKQFHNFIGSFGERGIVNFFLNRLTPGAATKYDADKVPEFQGEMPKEADDDATGDTVDGDL